MHRGKLITFEGIDGCGKTTQLGLLTEWLRGSAFRVTTTRQPAGTPIGRQIRDILANPVSDGLTPLTELALMFAARTQHIERVILPALESSELVLSDRFTDSSVAYQGYGRGLPLDVIGALERLFCKGIRPDFTLIIDIDPETGELRTGARNRAALEPESRFEREGIDFFRRVRQGYRELARQDPERVNIVDGLGSIPEVHERVRVAVDNFLSKAGVVASEPPLF